MRDIKRAGAVELRRGAGAIPAACGQVIASNACPSALQQCGASKQFVSPRPAANPSTTLTESPGRAYVTRLHLATPHRVASARPGQPSSARFNPLNSAPVAASPAPAAVLRRDLYGQAHVPSPQHAPHPQARLPGSSDGSKGRAVLSRRRKKGRKRLTVQLPSPKYAGA